METKMEPIGRSIVLPGCKLTSVGLEFVGEPTEETLNEIDLALQRLERSGPWWLGDFLCKRIDRDMAKEAKEKGITFETDGDRKGRMRAAVRGYADKRGLADWTCLEALCVAAFFPLLGRPNSLTFTHHAQIWHAGLPLEDAMKWLKRAEAGKWSKKKLRDELAAAKPSPEVDEPKWRSDLPREVSTFECWAATRWLEMQTIAPRRAATLLGEMPTTVKLVDHLRRVAGRAPAAKESFKNPPPRR